MDSRLYRHVFGDLPRSRTVNHSCIPCYNLVDPDIVKELSKAFALENGTETVSTHSDEFPFFRNFSYETDFTCVLYPGSGVVDRASKLVTDKLLWEKKLTSLTPKDCTKAMKSLKQGKRDATFRLNIALEKYLEHFKNDPEPDFKGDYNWLYTGGNIAGFVFGSGHYIIAANEINNSVVLSFTKVNPDFKGLNEEHREQRVFHIKNNEPVFQVSCTKEVDEFLFLTRQKRRITLFRMIDNSGRYYWTQKINDGLFICSDLNSQSRTVATLDSFHETNIYDMENGQKTVLFKGKAKSPSWAQVIFNSNGTSIYLADQNSVNVVDLREASNASLLYERMPTTCHCDVICNVIKKQYAENTFLIATSHNLLELDIRNKKISQKWTHLMTSPPQFGKTSFRNGEEIIILQSENPDEMVGIVNQSINSDFQFLSKSSPRVFESIRRKWNKAQLNGISHPSITERLEFAVTGLEILDIFADPDDGPHILTVNGGGDVVVNKLKRNKGERDEKENRDISEESVKGLKEFEHHCLQIYSEEMTADEIVDMSPLIKVLEEENLVKEDFKCRKPFWPQSEMFSPESLSYFKDYMAERILELWDIKMKNFWDEDENEEDNKEFYEKFGLSKVVQWMEKND